MTLEALTMAETESPVSSLRDLTLSFVMIETTFGTAGELYDHLAIYRAILNFCNLSVKNIASAQLTRSKVFRDHDRTSLEDRIRKFSLLQAQRIRAANGNDCHDFLATFERQVDLCIDSPPRDFCDGPGERVTCTDLHEDFSFRQRSF